MTGTVNVAVQQEIEAHYHERTLAMVRNLSRQHCDAVNIIEGTLIRAWFNVSVWG